MVEKVQQVPAVLINEVGLDVPQVQTVEVFKQTANATSQRIVQTGVQHFKKEYFLQTKQGMSNISHFIKKKRNNKKEEKQ